MSAPTATTKTLVGAGAVAALRSYITPHVSGSELTTDGRLILRMAPESRHNSSIAAAIEFLFGIDRDPQRNMGILIPGKVTATGRPGWNEPDVMFDPIWLDDRQGMATSATVVVEVVSDSSAKRDQKEKVDEYGCVDGLREYWIVDGRGGLEPRKASVEIVRYVDGVVESTGAYSTDLGRKVHIVFNGERWRIVDA